MSVLRMLALGTWLHLKVLSRSPVEIATGLVVPVVQSTLAVFLLRASEQPQHLIQAAVGAGLMGIWSSVLFGSGEAIHTQRWQGTLEMVISSPRHPALVVLPMTIATGLQGVYSMAATLGWAYLLFGISPTFAHPLLFLIAVPVCVVGLGMFGLLMASTFVLMRNANAFCNALEYPIWLLSGMLVPITVLPGWTEPLAKILPTTWGARAVHEAATGGSVWPALGLCFAIGLVCLGLGAVVISYVERLARAAATLSLT